MYQAGRRAADAWVAAGPRIDALEVAEPIAGNQRSA
jgi:hypothetical protein